MHDYVCFDGETVAAGDANITAVSSAALYGRGVFTTIAIRNGSPFLWEKHWRRLQNDSAAIDFDISAVSEASMKYALAEVIAKNSVEYGRARITVFDESPSMVWSSQTERKTKTLITTANLREVPKDFCVEVSPARVSSLSKTTRIKSCNYLDNLIAFEETRRRGFDEAIRLNERGEIVSACMANVFWLKGGGLFTPDAKTGCVPGTTREFVLENLQCLEVEALPDELRGAEAIFLTSAGLGVARVDRFRERRLSGEDHPILKIIR
ncbi:MAG TPA: aminotransferase class IV [Pyrinomonadaceae bacterium]|nr:aminotransferase class IV [Pyrinomonadaceae bacterium]